MKPLLSAIAAAVLMTAGCAPTGAGSSGPPVRDTAAAPEEDRAEDVLRFTATTLTGRSLDAADLAGEPVVLWFWAPWCTICRSEAPEVAAVAAESVDDVTFLGVAGLGPERDMKEFVEETGTGHFEHLVDADGLLWRRFGVVSQPAFVFVAADGSVERFGGALDGEALRAAVDSLVAD